MIDDAIQKNFGRIWPRHVASFTQFLIDCRRQFDGDIDLLLVLCIIGDRTFSQRRAPSAMDFETWATQPSEVTPEDINIQSISDFSDMPRETVRRKVNALVEKGWVVRDERGFIAATDKAKTDLEPLTLITLTYLSQMKATLLDT